MGGGVGLGVGAGVGTGVGTGVGCKVGAGVGVGTGVRVGVATAAGVGEGVSSTFSPQAITIRAITARASTVRILNSSTPFCSNRRIRADAVGYVTKYTNGDWGFSTDFLLFAATLCPVCSQERLQRKGVIDALPDEILRRALKSRRLSSSTAARVDNGGNSL